MGDEKETSEATSWAKENDWPTLKSGFFFLLFFEDTIFWGPLQLIVQVNKKRKIITDYQIKRCPYV